jgi:hypothetical protein
MQVMDSVMISRKRSVLLPSRSTYEINISNH